MIIHTSNNFENTNLKTYVYCILCYNKIGVRYESIHYIN